MPFPWANRIATYEGEFTVGLNVLTVDTPPEVFAIGLGSDPQQYGDAKGAAAAVDSLGTSSTPAPGYPQFVGLKGVESGSITPSIADTIDRQWGDTPVSDSFGSFVDTPYWDGQMITAFGGRLWDSSASAVTFGVESYWYWKESVTGYTGGASTVAMPSFTHILLDWGNDSANRVTTYLGNPIPCPTGGLMPDDASMLHVEQHVSTFDPNGFNNRLIGFILGPEYAAEDLLQSGYTSVNIVQSDDEDYPIIGGNYAARSQANDVDCWGYWVASDGATSKDVLVRYTPTPLYTSVGVVGDADCDLYTAKWSNIPDGPGGMTGLGDDFFQTQGPPTEEGWISFFTYSPAAEDNWPQRFHTLLTTQNHSTFQKMIVEANDEAACDYINSGQYPAISVDRHGKWIFYWDAFTYYPTFDDADNETNGIDFPAAWFYADMGEDSWLGFECPGVITPPDDPDGDDGGPGGPPESEIDLPGTGALRLTAWGFRLDGHDMYVIRLNDQGTILYDLTTGQWSEWSSPNALNLRLFTGQNWLGMGADSYNGDAATTVIGGDDTENVLWTLDPSQGYDEDPDDATPLAFRRTVIGGVPMRLRDTLQCGAAYLTCCVGDPQIGGAEITLETSDDYGNTWQDHGTLNTTTSDFDQEVVWRALGLIKAPGRIFRINDNGATVRIDSLDIR